MAPPFSRSGAGEVADDQQPGPLRRRPWSDRLRMVGAVAVGQLHHPFRLELQRRLAGPVAPAEHGRGAVEAHAGARQDQRIVPVPLEVTDAQAVQVEEPLLNLTVQLQAVPAALSHLELQQQGPPLDDGPAQAHCHPVALHHDPFDIEAVFLGRNAHEGRDVRILPQPARQRIAVAADGEHGGGRPVFAPPQRIALPLPLATLERQPTKEEAVRVVLQHREPLHGVGVEGLLLLGLVASAAVGADHP